MTEQSTAHAPASVADFGSARKVWLRARVTELSEALSDFGPQLHALIPADLGDRRLVDALVLCRVAADEARVQPVAETVAWLELLIPHGHRHDLADAVRRLRSALTVAEDPALWSWHAQEWEELVLALWRSDRARAVEPGRTDDELVSRWGVRTADSPHPEWAQHENGLSFTPLTEHLADEAEEPLSLLAGAVLSQPHVVEAIENSLAVYEGGLQGAGHLTLIAEQELCAQELGAWCDKHPGGASQATEDFLTELYESVETYSAEVLDPLIRSLSAYERTLFRTAMSPERRDRNAYLTEFLDCVANPSASAWTDGVLDPGVAEEAAERQARGELTWHSMRGSVPVWYHIVTSPQERAAALAFSGTASSSAIRVDVDVVLARQGTLFEGLGLDGPEDWYPEPGIGLRYSQHSATDLCELLTLAELGHARLEFVIRGTDGRFVLLRSLRAEVQDADASAWCRGVLYALRKLVPDVDDLADVIASEEPTDHQDDEDEWEDGWDDEEEDEQGQPDATPTASGSDTPEAPAPPKSARLSDELLAKVKAILRLAENPAATKAEAEAFLQKATAMMAKYGIEQAMLRGDDPAVREKPADRVVEVVAPWMGECKRLLSAIAFAMRCHPIYPGGKANKHRVHLFGFPSDLHSVEVLYASLRLQMLQGADRADARHRPPGELPRAYKRSWMLGFIRAVALRIGEAERAAREDSERERAEAAATDTSVQGRSVALVLADRTTEVETEVASRYPKLGKVRRTRFTGSGYRQGHVDGQQADIGGLALDDENEEWDELTA
ncbi:hypothetical protein QF035_007292 [Streptomyces umbrinus]|uniref:DUF2786 domain-containing protein n=1 Tax=Streptomyces umbrinus TaxID=67370 RepID=A0ABU0T1N9_9ACTN|nr:DUF2786 domain-containing protein [Streptomyces umbrinus]MDQ1029710.1 hypothetical protein [Streptomyces umbrinus]